MAEGEEGGFVEDGESGEVAGVLARCFYDEVEFFAEAVGSG